MLSINFDLSILTTQKGISLFGKIPFVFTLKRSCENGYAFCLLVGKSKEFHVKLLFVWGGRLFCNLFQVFSVELQRNAALYVDNFVFGIEGVSKNDIAFD